METPDIFHDSTAHDSETHDATTLHGGTGGHHASTGHDEYEDQSQQLGASAASTEIGNPNEYEHYWFYQGKDGYCAPSSVTQVIEAQSDHTLNGYTAVVSEAHKLGIPFDGTGMTLPQAQELLTAFGVPSHLDQPASTDQAFEELGQYLEQGRSVILSVNADPIWYGTETSSANPDGGPDHALVVTAINAQTGEVTLSDPGTPDGNEEQVPLDTFKDAWEASGYTMIVSDHAAGSEDQHVWSDTQRDEGITTASAHHETIEDIAADTVHHGATDAGFVILSISLGMGIRRMAHAARTTRTARTSNHQPDGTAIGEIEA
jgi:hypothetical protein